MQIDHSTVTRFFAAVQIAGAAIAIIILLMTVPALGSDIVGWALFGTLLFIAAIALIGGIAYWRSRPWGYYVTAAAYILQLVQVSSELAIFKLSFGVAALINLTGTGGWLDLNLGSQTVLVLWPGVSATSISLNIFAGFGLAVIVENALRSKRTATTETGPDHAGESSD